MRKAPRLVCRTRKIVEQVRDLRDHCVVVRRIITSNGKELLAYVSSGFTTPYPSHRTLSLIPKSSRIFTNAAARLRPE